MIKEYIECRNRENLIGEIYDQKFDSRIPLEGENRCNINFKGFSYFSPETLGR